MPPKTPTKAQREHCQKPPKGGKAIIAETAPKLQQEGEQMKPIAAENLKGIAEALMFINTRADLLHSLCRSAQDTAQASNGGAEDDRKTVNRLFELLIILEDEIDLLTQEI